MCVHLRFNYKKAVQALSFLAQKSGGRINKMKAIKLIYFADRYHLRKFGRPVTNDEYYAMPFGPINSGAKDLSERTAFLGPKEKDYSVQFIEPIDWLDYKSIHDLDPTVFSESDLEALSFAWERFGNLDQFQLAKLTHQYPEWKKHEEALGQEDTSRIPMKYEDFFDDPPGEFDKCYALNSEERSDRMEELKELAAIEALWS